MRNLASPHAPPQKKARSVPILLLTLIKQLKSSLYVSNEFRHLNLLSILVENVYLACHVQFEIGTVNCHRAYYVKTFSWSTLPLVCPPFGHANANFSVFIDHIRTRFLEK